MMNLKNFEKHIDNKILERKGITPKTEIAPPDNKQFFCLQLVPRKFLFTPVSTDYIISNICLNTGRVTLYKLRLLMKNI